MSLRHRDQMGLGVYLCNISVFLQICDLIHYTRRSFPNSGTKCELYILKAYLKKLPSKIGEVSYLGVLI